MDGKETMRVTVKTGYVCVLLNLLILQGKLFFYINIFPESSGHSAVACCFHQVVLNRKTGVLWFHSEAPRGTHLIPQTAAITRTKAVKYNWTMLMKSCWYLLKFHATGDFQTCLFDVPPAQYPWTYGSTRESCVTMASERHLISHVAPMDERLSIFWV